MADIPRIKQAGAWKIINNMRVKQAGVWKVVQQAWIKQGGVWKRFFVTGPIFIPTIQSFFNDLGSGPEYAQSSAAPGQIFGGLFEIDSLVQITEYARDSNNVPIGVNTQALFITRRSGSLPQMTARLTNVTTGASAVLNAAGVGGSNPYYTLQINRGGAGDWPANPWPGMFRNVAGDIYRVSPI